MDGWIYTSVCACVCVCVCVCVCACARVCMCTLCKKGCLKNSDEKTGMHRWKAFEKEVMRIPGPRLRVFEKWVIEIHGPTGLGCLRNKYIQGPKTHVTGEFWKELHNL